MERIGKIKMKFNIEPLIWSLKILSQHTYWTSLLLFFLLRKNTIVKTGQREIHDAQNLKYQSLESTQCLLAPSQTSQVEIKSSATFKLG
jgi:hypothetical protein